MSARIAGTLGAPLERWRGAPALARRAQSVTGRLGQYERSANILIGASAGVVVVAGAVAALATVANRPGIMPAFLLAAVAFAFMLLRPAWIVPFFIGLTWTAIGRSFFGGFAPVNYASYLLVPLALWFALSRQPVARATALVFALIALPLVATGLLATGGPTISGADFKELAFLVIAALCIRGPSDVERTIIVLACTGIFLALGAVYSVRVHPTSLFPLDTTGAVPGHPATAESPRAAGPFGESNFFALSLAVLVPLCLYLVTRGGRRAWLGGLAVVILIAGVYATGSRGGALTVALGLAAVAFTSRSRRLKIATALAVCAGGLLLLLFTAQASSSASRTVSGRATENLIAWAMFRDHPLVGVGPGQYPNLYRDYALRIGNDPRTERAPHSLPLQIAAEQGIAGLLGWLAAAVFVIRTIVVRRAWRTALGRAVSISAGTYLFGSIFLHGSQLRLLYILVGLVITLGLPQARAAPRSAE